MKPASIRAVCFDFGGVIARTSDQTSRQRLAKRLGHSLEELYALVFGGESGRQASLGAISAEQHWEYVMTALGLLPESLPAFTEEFFAGDFLDLSLVNFIRSLQPSYRTGLISNAWSDLREYLQRRQIADIFDEIVISAEVGMMKPEAGIYLLALERLGVKPQEAVFLDDFAENVEAARGLGMHAIHFVNPNLALEELKRVLSDHH